MATFGPSGFDKSVSVVKAHIIGVGAGHDMDTRSAAPLRLGSKCPYESPANALIAESRRHVDVKMRRISARQITESGEIANVGKARARNWIVDRSYGISNHIT